MQSAPEPFTSWTVFPHHLSEINNELRKLSSLSDTRTTLAVYIFHEERRSQREFNIVILFVGTGFNTTATPELDRNRVHRSRSVGGGSKRSL
jgi:hypothetical protein